MITGQNSSSLIDCFCDPSYESLTIFLIDEATNGRCLITRISYDDLFGRFDKFFNKNIFDTFVYENSLDGDTTLSGLIKRTYDTTFDNIVPILYVCVDDGAGVATELEDGFFLACVLFHLPADLGRSGETEQSNTFICHQLLANFSLAR